MTTKLTPTKPDQYGDSGVMMRRLFRKLQRTLNTPKAPVIPIKGDKK